MENEETYIFVLFKQRLISVIVVQCLYSKGLILDSDLLHVFQVI